MITHDEYYRKQCDSSQNPESRYSFYCSCVNWPPNDVHSDGGLCDLISESATISRRTFLKHVDREELSDIEQSLGYSQHPSQGLTMSADWHVEYFRSKHHGKRVYGFKYSAIEYVFTQ